MPHERSPSLTEAPLVALSLVAGAILLLICIVMVWLSDMREWPLWQALRDAEERHAA